MQSNRQGHRRQRAQPSDSWLKGLIVDQHGHRLIPSHSQKRSKRYRYYLSEPLVTKGRQAAPEGWRLPAAELEKLVLDQLVLWLGDARAVIAAFDALPEELVEPVTHRATDLTEHLAVGSQEGPQGVRAMLQRVTVSVEAIELVIMPSALVEGLANAGSAKAAALRWRTPATLKRCGMAMRLIVPGPHRAGIPDKKHLALIHQGRVWRDLLISGEVRNIGEIAQRHNVTRTFVTRTIYRACMATDVVRALLNASQPPTLTSEALKRAVPLPFAWDEQRSLLGFTA